MKDLSNAYSMIPKILDILRHCNNIMIDFPEFVAQMPHVI